MNKKKMSLEKFRELLAAGLSISEIARALGGGPHSWIVVTREGVEVSRKK